MNISQIAARLRFFNAKGWDNLRPVLWASDCKPNIVETLLATPVQFPFGFCMSNEKYLVSAKIDWDLLPLDLVITNQSLILVGHMLNHLTMIGLNCGKRPIKTDNGWSHIKVSLKAEFDFNTDDLMQIISNAQIILDSILELEFSDKPSTFSIKEFNVFKNLFNTKSNISLSIHEHLMLSAALDAGNGEPWLVIPVLQTIADRSGLANAICAVSGSWLTASEIAACISKLEYVDSLFDVDCRDLTAELLIAAYGPIDGEAIFLCTRPKSALLLIEQNGFFSKTA